MCDYSLQDVKSRPAAVADKLIVHNFGKGTRGFCAAGDTDTAVCVLPGTELAFANPVEMYSFPFLGKVGPVREEIKHTTAIFRQVDKSQPHTHHDALEFPDGSVMKLAHLAEGQEATVLQLPAAPKTEAEAQEQTRLEVVG